MTWMPHTGQQEAIAQREKEAKERKIRREAWKSLLYSNPFLEAQPGYVCYKRGGKIIVQRQMLSGPALKRRMGELNMRVVK